MSEFCVSRPRRWTLWAISRAFWQTLIVIWHIYCGQGSQNSCVEAIAKPTRPSSRSFPMLFSTQVIGSLITPVAGVRANPGFMPSNPLESVGTLPKKTLQVVAQPKLMKWPFSASWTKKFELMCLARCGSPA